jgi:hypothetical protein
MGISCSITPLENATKKLKDLKGTKKGLPEYLQMGAAWKVFGKWMVASGQSDQNEVKIGNYLKKSGHVCIVLRGIGFSMYFYELIGDFEPEQYEIFNVIRFYLDRVLVTNQYVSYKLGFFLRKEGWVGEVFPKFFAQYPEKKIGDYSDEIDDDIERYSNIEYVHKNINRKQLHGSIISPTKSKMKYDIKGCYVALLSIFNTIKHTIPQDNLIIIEDLIERCEHGYFLGFLLEKTLEDFEKKYPGTKNAGDATETFIRQKLKKYTIGRENRVTTATKEAFGLTPDIVERLNRMFIYKKVVI